MMEKVEDFFEIIFIFEPDIDLYWTLCGHFPNQSRVRFPDSLQRDRYTVHKEPC